MNHPPPTANVLAELNFADAEFGAGRADAYQDLYSHSDDVTIFGVFGGHEQGWTAVGPRLVWAATQFKRSGSDLERTVIASSFGSHIGYMVTLERSTATTIAGTTEMGSLRVTHVFRLENDQWKIVHRHADPLLDKRPPQAST